MNKEVIRNWSGRCHSCGEKRTPEQLTQNNGMVCQKCYEQTMANYEASVKVGKHNNPVIFCQDCKTQFKLAKKKVSSPFEDWDDNVSVAERVHEGIPYKINPLYLARWKCQCKRQSIITIGMPYTNWAEGYIEKRAEDCEKWDSMTDKERDIADGITEKPCENPRSARFPKGAKK